MCELLIVFSPTHWIHIKVKLVFFPVAPLEALYPLGACKQALNALSNSLQVFVLCMLPCGVFFYKASEAGLFLLM